MNMLYKVFPLAILICFTVGYAKAETTVKSGHVKKTQRKAVVKKDATTVKKYDQSIFDSTRTALPMAYMGHDASKISDTINHRNNISKDEFETTQQYNHRFTEERAKPIVGNMSADGLYAFMIKPIAEYDADNKSLMLYITNIGSKSVVNDFETSDLGIKYINYGNMNKEVILSLINNYNQFEWRIRNDSTLRNEYILSDIKLRIDHLSPDTAKEYKYQIRVLFIVKLIDPYNTKKASDAPTPSSERKSSSITCNAIEIWLYDFNTGSVIKKIPLFQNSIPITFTSENPTRDVFADHYTAINSATKDRDPKAIASLLTSDFVEDTKNSGLARAGEKTAEQMINRICSEPKESSENFTTKVLSVKVNGDVATVSVQNDESSYAQMMAGNYRWVAYTSLSTDTWIKSNGKWLLRRKVVNSFKRTQ